ncbi:MAG: hypothetical protein CSA21_02320 [Deltaproteobacteria bacterium]|nr:MAG: hypothetical protein CSA21_02320 [Deltaproteobacteria bacterium]
MKVNLCPRLVLTTVLICLGLLGGCVQSQKRTLTAKYVMPPRVVRDVSALQNLVIAPPRVVLSGNYDKAKKLIPVFVNCLNQRLISGIYQERFFNVQDEIHGNPKGVAALNKTFAHAHGYSIKSRHAKHPARIQTWATVELTRSRGQDRVVTSLATVPYDIKYSDEGVPYSVPDTDNQDLEERITHVDFVTIKAKGDLRVEVRDTKGQVVYTKTFKALHFEKKVGGDTPVEALPTALEIATTLFEDPIAAIVKDISPHKEERSLVVNEQGDATAVVLMKATAFSEAYKRLDTVLQKHQALYESEAQEIKQTFSQKIQDAKAEGATPEALAALRQEEQAALVKAGLFRSPDFENMAIVCETMGLVDEALLFYGQAAEANPENTQAAFSLKRVSECAGKAMSSAQLQGEYEEEENKEH